MIERHVLFSAFGHSGSDAENFCIFAVDMTLPELNFPAADLHLRRGRDGRRTVFDAVRGKYIVLTPEEWVRQHLLHYLMSFCGVPLRSIVTEYPVNLNGTAQRADVVVVEPSGAPLLLAECKAHDVTINQSVLDQAVRYNMILQARYIVLTNGLKHYCYERAADGSYVTLKDFPQPMSK